MKVSPESRWQTDKAPENPADKQWVPSCTSVWVLAG